MKKNKFKKKENYIILLIFMLAVSVIGTYNYLSNNKVIEVPKLTKPKEEVKKINILNPDSKTRPYAVMINNIGAARPYQSGLQDAYIIYEMIVEGGLTRYLALFVDVSVERIGSVRSARHYYLDYALENDAFYVHHGQSPRAANDFSSLSIDRIVADSGSTGWRDKTLNVSSEHTLFTNTEKLANGIGNKRTERNRDFLLTYSTDSLDLKDAKEANNVLIEYSSQTKTSYEYDSENKVYKRLVNGKEHIDYVTKKQYTFKNIIVYQVENTSLDSEGRQDLNNIGSGTGYLITEGKYVPITWSKSSRSSQTIYKYEDGKKLVVNDGNTFIQIQPKNKTLEIN